MATMRDIVAGAYSRLGLLPLGAELDAQRAVAGLTVLNDLLQSFKGRASTKPTPSIRAGGDLINGTYTQSSTPNLGIAHEIANTAYGLSAAFPLAEKHVLTVKCMLAIELANASGTEASASTIKQAKNGWRAIEADYIQAPTAEFDGAVVYTPSNPYRRGGSGF